MAQGEASLGAPLKEDAHLPQDDAPLLKDDAPLLKSDAQLLPCGDPAPTDEELPVCELTRDAYSVGILCVTRGFDIFHLATTRRQKVSAVVTGLSAFAILALNFGLQFFLMIFSTEFVMEPMVEDMQALYGQFKAEALSPDGTFSLPVWRHWPRDERESLCQVPLAVPKFFLTVLLLWSFLMVAEVRASGRWTIDIMMLPDRPEGKNIIIVAEDGRGVIRYMTPWLRFIIVVFVLLPKLVAGGALWYIGCRWLTSTDQFADLILNSCALGFVVSVDEIIFEGLLPDRMKLQVVNSGLYSKRVRARDWHEPDLTVYAEALGWFTLAAVATTFYIFKFQKVIPDYDWGVPINEACMNFKY